MMEYKKDHTSIRYISYRMLFAWRWTANVSHVECHTDGVDGGVGYGGIYYKITIHIGVVGWREQYL